MAVLAVCCATTAARGQQAVEPTIDEVVQRLGAYVASYGEQASLIVAVERYTQYATTEDGTRPRQLEAEFALVKTAGPVGWTGFRDVVKVDGDEVRDRSDRLQRVLSDPSSSLAEARRIADESARFNIGAFVRNLNVPTTTLLFFHPDNLPRFAFKLKGRKTIDGKRTWELTFQERARPTLVMTRAGKDVPCEGTLWVVPETGQVVRTRLRLRGFADAMTRPDWPSAPQGTQSTGTSTPPASQPQAPAPTPPPTSGGEPGGTGSSGGGTQTGTSGQGTAPTGGGAATGGPDTSRPRANRGDEMMDLPRRVESQADIEVTYRHDPTVGMWLPARMSEWYEGMAGYTRAVATYSDFKRFRTTAKIVEPR
jgi:hypothetical protein